MRVAAVAALRPRRLRERVRVLIVFDGVSGVCTCVRAVTKCACERAMMLSVHHAPMYVIDTYIHFVVNIILHAPRVARVFAPARRHMHAV